MSYIKIILKIAVIGCNCVGKSTLCNAISKRPINSEYQSTIGVDLIETHYYIENSIFKLQLWDTAGYDKFERIVYQYIINSPIILFCYSADSYQSYQNMIWRHKNYESDIKSNNKHIIIVLTKADIKPFDNAEELGRIFANSYNYNFIKTSSFTLEGIKELKETIIGIKQKINNKSQTALNGSTNQTKESSNLCWLV